MDSFPDVPSLTDGELKDLIRKLTAEEAAISPDRRLHADVREVGETGARISYRRRILHGKLDILGGALVERRRKKAEEEGTAARTPEPYVLVRPGASVGRPGRVRASTSGEQR
jgi:hypothetical protein